MINPKCRDLRHVSRSIEERFQLQNELEICQILTRKIRPKQFQCQFRYSQGSEQTDEEIKRCIVWALDPYTDPSNTHIIFEVRNYIIAL